MRLPTAVAVTYVLLFAFASSAHAAAYYVALNGDDSASGSIDAPFRTISKAAQMARPGDVVNVRGGTHSGTATIQSKGTASAPIVFRAMPGEAAILDGTGNASNRAIVDINGAEYVDFSGFEVRNSPYIGIVLWHARNIRLLDNHIHHTVRNGIYAGGDVMPACADITVSGNSVHDTVLENQFHNMSGGGWAGAVVVSRTERSTITNNRIWNNDGEGIISLRSNHALIRDNEISDNFSVYLYLDNARFATVDRNFLYSTGNTRYYRDGRPGAGIGIANETKDVMNPSSDNVFTNNIVVGTRWGFYYGNYESGGGLRNTKVLNNTFYGTTEAIIRIEDDTHANSVVSNNIFYQTGSPAPTRAGMGLVTYQNNLWYGGSAGPAASVSDILANPQFVSAGGFAAGNYKLTPPSPALAAGVANAAVTTDFWGSARASIFDVGAHQLTGEVPVPDVQAPTAPGSLSASASPSAASIALSWTASTDNVAVTGYKIHRNGAFVATVSGATWTDTTVALATTYHYTVAAIDAAGNESQQATASATTIATLPVADSQAPTVPTGLSLVPTSGSTIHITWNAAVDNTAVTGYRIYRNDTYVATVTTLTWTDTGLRKKTTYHYGVAAIDAAGNESARVAGSAKTPNK